MTKLVPAIHGLKERRGCPAENRAWRTWECRDI